MTCINNGIAKVALQEAIDTVRMRTAEMNGYRYSSRVEKENERAFGIAVVAGFMKLRDELDAIIDAEKKELKVSEIAIK